MVLQVMIRFCIHYNVHAYIYSTSVAAGSDVAGVFDVAAALFASVPVICVSILLAASPIAAS